MKDVEFQDLVYTVPDRRNSGHRCLLKGVSGVFRHGQLSAIMGPSGAGKSSLLNAISGYRVAGVKGTIRINKKTSCYITQEDYHQPLLTVHEMMKVACSLKLKAGTDHAPIIDDILKSLHLNHRRTVTACRLSGGERKRLSIALELVANPTVFFLDEPTSGLDEVTAAQCIRLLKSLAKQDRTVVCTIHQPSAAIFALFDEIFILAQGECVYQGIPKELVSFLTYSNYDCPRHYNPADYVIELCDSDSYNIIPKFSKIFDNGKLICTSVTNAATGQYASLDNNQIMNVSNNNINLMEDQQHSGIAAPPSFVIKPTLTSMILDTSRPKEAPLMQKMKSISRFMKSQHAVSSSKQFTVLFNLMMLKIWRNKTVLLIQFFHHIVCGLFIGVIFLNAANEGSRMFDHLKFCMGCVFFVVYTQVMVPILSFPQEIKIVKKECFNRWYGLTPYYCALTVSRLPFQIFFNLIFSSLVYFLSGLPVEFCRFSLFAMVGIIVSFVAEGMGLLIGATFSVTNGCAVGPMVMAPFLGLAAFGFDFAADISMFMYGIMKLSFIRGGVVSIVLVVFGYNRNQLHCNDLYCHFDDPKVLLRYLRIENVSLWTEVGFLLLILLFFRSLCYISLRRRFYK